MTTSTTKINGTTYTMTHNPEKTGTIGEIILDGERGARYYSTPNQKHEGLFHFIRFTRSSFRAVWDSQLFTLDGYNLRKADTSDIR